MSSMPASVPTLSFRPERPADGAVAERLIAAAFGPGRFVKTAERLREGASPAPGLSFIAWRDETPLGSVRLWPIRIGTAPALLLGPIAVAASNRSQGLGAQLVEAACAAAAAAGWGLVLLVGDEAYFGRMGFHAVPPGAVTLPGPVDYRRVLWRVLAAGATDGAAGAVTSAEA